MCLLNVHTVRAANLSFTLLGTHPEAAAQSSASGKYIDELEIFNNKVYAGYGDYNANTGPIKINPYDLTTHAFTGSLLTVPTEEINNFRIINDKLYVPMIDPTCAGNCSGGYAVGEPWVNNAPISAVHIFDIATFDGTDLWLAGSNNNGAALWRSTDGGTNWNIVMTDVSSPPTGAERYYWIEKLNGKLYVQAGGVTQNAPYRIFDGTSWTTGTQSWITAPGRKVVNFSGRIIANRDHTLTAFDGTTVDNLNYGKDLIDIYADGDYFYVLNANSTLSRSKDMVNWEELGSTPSGSYSVAAHDGVVYIGTTDSKIYSAVLPLEPTSNPTTASTTTVVPLASSTKTASSQSFSSVAAGVEGFPLGTTAPSTTLPAATEPKEPQAVTTAANELKKSSKLNFVWYIGLGGLSLFLIYGIFLVFRP